MVRWRSLKAHGEGRKRWLLAPTTQFSRAILNVAQVINLLGSAQSGGDWERRTLCRLEIGDTADCRSALRMGAGQTLDRRRSGPPGQSHPQASSARGSLDCSSIVPRLVLDCSSTDGSTGNHPITMRCMDSGRLAATRATTLPLRRLTNVARRLPPRTTESTPKVAAISMMVSAGESLTL